jgi:hypothetical protein
MTELINIDRKMVDTVRVIFELSSKKMAVQLTPWSQFALSVFTITPITLDHVSVAAYVGVLESTGKNGRVYFVPDGTIPRGAYSYEARGVDGNGELRTFAAGSYTVT